MGWSKCLIFYTLKWSKPKPYKRFQTFFGPTYFLNGQNQPIWPSRSIFDAPKSARRTDDKLQTANGGATAVRVAKFPRSGAISIFDQIGSNLAQVTFGPMSTISPIKKLIRKLCQNYGNSTLHALAKICKNLQGKMVIPNEWPFLHIWNLGQMKDFSNKTTFL